MREIPHLGVIVASICVALLLMIVPLSNTLIWYRPVFPLMIIAYWAMFAPDYVSLGTAWFIGICCDVLMGTILGEHALALAIVIYVVLRAYMQLRMYSILQQSLFIGLLTGIYQVVLFCTEGFLGNLPNNLAFWSPIFTTVFCWPLLVLIVGNFQRRTSTTKAT